MCICIYVYMYMYMYIYMYMNMYMYICIYIVYVYIYNIIYIYTYYYIYILLYMVSIFGILKSHNFIVDSPFSDRLRTARWVSPIPALIKAGMDICSTFGPGFSSPPGPKIVGSLAEKKRKTLLGRSKL